MAQRPVTRSSASQESSSGGKNERTHKYVNRLSSIAQTKRPASTVMHNERGGEEEHDGRHPASMTEGQSESPPPSKRAKTRPSESPIPIAGRPRELSQSTFVEGTLPGEAKDLRPFRWEALEYFILAEIFKSASHPLDNITSMRWLLSAVRICKHSAEPALAVLYRSPHLLSQNMAHKFADSIANPPEHPWCQYATKVKSLQIDVGAVASTVYRGVHLDIGDLIRRLPTLVDVDLYHSKDLSPYRQLTQNIRWTYPVTLLQALGIKATGIQCGQNSTHRLKSWRWSARMMDPQRLPISSLREVHEAPTFASLETISLVNFQIPSVRAPRDFEALQAEDREYTQQLASSMTVLPNLKHLVLESSSVVDGRFLSLLPKTIQCLELINCWEITAGDFAGYLETHGEKIRHLVLHHNQALSLAFLPYLGRSCPNLRTLSMNLTYYSQHEFYNDSRPMYDELLTVTDVPTWPASVEAIELEQLRKWSPEAAEMFFRSFVENAPNLLSLRRLSIKAMLDVPWRQRCQFRDEWEGKLKRVFLRQVDGLRAVVRPGNACEKTGNQGKQYRSSRSAHAAKGTPARRSGRIATSHDPSSPSSRTVKGLREVRRGPLSYKDPDTDDDIGAASESDASGPLTDEQQHPSPAGQDEVTFIQGLCEVVDIKFDNQKPREMQYGMSDFLDLDEGREEDDDDWASGEDGDIDNDDTYAW